MKKIFENDWQELLEGEMEKDYYQNLRKFLIKEYSTQTIYPDMYHIFNALHYTSYKDVKVVIFGQDPYHGPNQACGFSFSVQKGVAIPPSLRNIYKELNSDLGYKIPNHGSLEKWAKEGVLLLNAVLTVRRGEPNSHQGRGWEIFTNKIIELLNERKEPIVFILWGKKAQEKEALITNDRHLIIKSSHPSPFSAHRGFLGSKPFSKTNEFLIANKMEPIDWEIEDI